MAQELDAGAYDSLSECINAIKKDLSTVWKDRDVVFRGEPLKYDHTFSLVHRIIYEQRIIPVSEEPYLLNQRNQIALKMHVVLNRIPLFATPQEAIAAAKKRGPTNPVEVLGSFLQHYYLPTESPRCDGFTRHRGEVCLIP